MISFHIVDGNCEVRSRVTAVRAKQVVVVTSGQRQQQQDDTLTDLEVQSSVLVSALQTRCSVLAARLMASATASVAVSRSLIGCY